MSATPPQDIKMLGIYGMYSYRDLEKRIADLELQHICDKRHEVPEFLNLTTSAQDRLTKENEQLKLDCAEFERASVQLSKQLDKAQTEWATLHEWLSKLMEEYLLIAGQPIDKVKDWYEQLQSRPLPSRPPESLVFMLCKLFCAHTIDMLETHEKADKLSLHARALTEAIEAALRIKDLWRIDVQAGKWDDKSNALHQMCAKLTQALSATTAEDTSLVLSKTVERMGHTLKLLEHVQRFFQGSGALFTPNWIASETSYVRAELQRLESLINQINPT